MIAANHGREAVVRALLAVPTIDVSTKGRECHTRGKTALYLAQREARNKNVKRESKRSLEAIIRLLEARLPK